ncbi:hypothetical protein M5W78_21090 [Paenibacillus larvae]|uniref:hypothetical protein n=1 Tax=Paenibacillus larvae TaxID=1464 RepID=UPI00227EC138|nr:hypothetical protein [Paenibacillus larvae]MCY9512352.1 hypothetical protein [Paenibacillus larvae]
MGKRNYRYVANIAKVVHSGNSHVFVDAQATAKTFADALAKSLQHQDQDQDQDQDQNQAEVE